MEILRSQGVVPCWALFLLDFSWIYKKNGIRVILLGAKVGYFFLGCSCCLLFICCSWTSWIVLLSLFGWVLLSICLLSLLQLLAIPVIRLLLLLWYVSMSSI